MAFPAISVSVLDTGQLDCPAEPAAVNWALSGVPRVTVTVAPLWAIVELAKMTVLPLLMCPAHTRVRLPLTIVAPVIATRLPPLIVTVIGWVPVPFQPATIVPGAI